MDKVVQQNASSAEEMASSMAMFKVTGELSNDFSDHRIERKTLKPVERPKDKNRVPVSTHEVKPEDVIPMKEGDFKDF